MKISITEEKLHSIIQEGILLENKKVAKQFLEQNKITQEDFSQIEQIDPTPTKKYMGWMAKILATEKPSIDLLRNAVTEYHSLLSRIPGKIKQKEDNLNKQKEDGKISDDEFDKQLKQLQLEKEKVDIYKIKTFSELQNLVDELNQEVSSYKSSKEKDFEVIADNSEIYVVHPMSWEASRRVCISKFAVNKKGQQDSPWCTGFGNDTHFVSYHLSQLNTFYYVLCHGPNITNDLKKVFGKVERSGHGVDLPKYEAYQKVAIMVKPYTVNGVRQEEVPFTKEYYEPYDATDSVIPWSDFVKYWEIINRYS